MVRRLRREDLQNGFLESLDALRPASGIDPGRAEEIFERIDSDPMYVVAVAEEGGRVIGATTLVIEQKFIHEGGLVGHIEDVAVSRGAQGRGAGTAILRYLLEEAGRRGCYKTILDCAEDVMPFHARLGFKPGVNQMRLDHA
ncbi:MAG: GNAT family N-acetyltransferase [Nitrosopumilus sp.]|nr:GNAT family N-acetyltransferase [Nitrosopumilus sp.]MDA7941349.1 GNAT family N-acetyltransferase [Nitrosopumilus sp.]MDA7942759.1 GNAT family N-acetyltransferase [Nitrosopumilus sp.]MDA7945357.1 GNAT family N-acetyltransferase [Nitrosopumilus sp.]MDA7952727.1 GNAT family N-acetyltransferase [Nitrosopumilus sp.]